MKLHIILELIFILVNRCDGTNDCPDASDEFNCHKIAVPESYLNEVPVPPDDGKLLADIHLSIDVIQVLELVEVESEMSLQYRLTLIWKDSRVSFRNLKEDTFLNTVGREDAGKIWYPKVIFYNTKDMEETKYNDKSVITVNRNGTPTVSSLKEIQNDHIYKGEENELILSQVYTTQFICEYDLRNYPFDVQKCSMIFIMQVRKDAFLYNVH